MANLKSFVHWNWLNLIPLLWFDMLQTFWRANKIFTMRVQSTYLRVLMAKKNSTPYSLLPFSIEAPPFLFFATDIFHRSHFFFGRLRSIKHSIFYMDICRVCTKKSLFVVTAFLHTQVSSLLLASSSIYVCASSWSNGGYCEWYVR